MTMSDLFLFLLVPADKSANNIFICWKLYYIKNELDTIRTYTTAKLTKDKHLLEYIQAILEFRSNVEKVPMDIRGEKSGNSRKVWENVINRKKRSDSVIRSYDKSPYSHRKLQNAKWQYKNAI